MTPLSMFPKPLLDDLVRGRWLPVVGAGFSRNAVVPGEGVMPLWKDLGQALAQEMHDYPCSTPLDAISAFEHEFSRPRLVERLGELLQVRDAQPGRAHGAFCSVPFDIVCTTNLEFLLERQYMLLGRYCWPVIDEDQLAVSQERTAVTLLKLHGDVHHPSRLVVTESDYDGFLDRYPLLATYLSSLLITRTAVFVGYSLNDPDFRQIWQVIADRLGKGRRTAYAILVAPLPHEIARFERRGVKVIAVADDGDGYGDTLAAVFRAVSSYWKQHVLDPEDIVEEEVREELTLPDDVPSRICFFSVPHDLQSFYRAHAFPVAQNHGLVPMTAEDIVRRGDNVAATIEALIARAHAVVVDASSRFTIQELAIARAQGKAQRTLVVLSARQQVTFEAAETRQLKRPADVQVEPSLFLSQLADWFSEVSVGVATSRPKEMLRLLQGGEFRAAVISAMTLLETTIRRALLDRGAPLSERITLGTLLRRELIAELVGPEYASRVDEWRRVRNRAVHTTEPVEAGVAAELVNGAAELIEQLADTAGEGS